MAFKVKLSRVVGTGGPFTLHVGHLILSQLLDVRLGCRHHNLAARGVSPHLIHSAFLRAHTDGLVATAALLSAALILVALADLGLVGH